MEVSIDQELKQAAPNLALGVLRASVHVSRKDPTLWEEITSHAQGLTRRLTIDTIAELPQIKALRQAYRSVGKDPSRFRGSQEALLRRILRGQPLYQINTVVDINNLVSLNCMHS